MIEPLRTMVKSLIFCALLNFSFLYTMLGQEVNTVQDDSVKRNGSHSALQGLTKQNSSNRVSGYAGIITTGSKSAIYGGINYVLKDNQSIRFEFLYGGGNNFLFQPALNLNSRIIAPSILYQYTIIGKSGYNSPYGFQNGSNGFNLYAFTGVGAQYLATENNVMLSETKITNPNSKNYSVVVPLGIGMSYKFDNNMTIGLEIRGNFHISSGGYTNPYSYGMNSFQNSYGQWGYPGVMYGQLRNGPGF